MYYFEVKIQYTPLEGKLVKNSFMVHAVSFADAEHKAIAEIKPYANDYEVLAIKILKVYDLINIEIDNEHIYVGKVKLITIQDNGSEVHKIVNMYVSAKNLTDAKTALQTAIADLDAELVAVVETKMVSFIQ
jgi:hypothetical protein